MSLVGDGLDRRHQPPTGFGTRPGRYPLHARYGHPGRVFGDVWAFLALFRGP